jgi:hypothetical protein
MTVDDVRRRLRRARAGVAAGASIRLVQHPKAASPEALTHATPDRAAAAPARVIACERCRRHGSTFESRHRAD